MISYELAKKLKDSGFAQTGESRFAYVIVRNEPNRMISGNKDFWESVEHWYVPTLSELIEAMGSPFQLSSFIRQGNDTERSKVLWVASIPGRISRKDSSQDENGGVQVSAEEAVSSLYLELSGHEEDDDWGEHVREMGELGVIVE
jgi:hypothetical protein